jgi:hypothetical protein
MAVNFVLAIDLSGVKLIGEWKSLFIGHSEL